MATKESQSSESQSSASATELAQALAEALQRNTAPRAVGSVIEPGLAQDAIKQYEAIRADLITLPLSK